MRHHPLTHILRAIYYKPALVMYLLLLSQITLAQSPVKTSINSIIAAIDTFNANRAPEKLYIQTDKPTYTLGDTIWFKTYLFDATYLSASNKSGVLYIELANDSNRLIKRMMLPLTIGIGWGNIALDKDELQQGGYVLRGYTNWMRNFDEDYVFTRHFYVSNSQQQDWLINARATVVTENDKQKARFNLQFANLDKSPVLLREMQLKVMEGSKLKFRNDVQTGMDGSLDVDFELPPKTGSNNFSIAVTDKRKGEGNRQLMIPVVLNRPEYTDLQFMPEGGNLIAGIAARVGFKALSEDGTGVNISGKIINTKGQEIASFQSVHKGMGAFAFIPAAGEVYTAKITLPNGGTKLYALPAVKPSGISIKVFNPVNADSLEVALTATPDLTAANQVYYLIGQSRGVICYGASLILNKQSFVFTINKQIFPSGVIRFTLLNAYRQPVNERLAFINHQDQLRVSISPHKPAYEKRDSVALNIQVSKKDGAPVQASFAVAVTDDAQVRADNSLSDNLTTHLLLATDLKGNIEEPGYYLASADADVSQHLDNLLLTQGWVGYDWSTVFGPQMPFTYPAEAEFVVKGKVTNLFNKPVANSGVTLLSKKPFMLMDTVTNQAGEFKFRNIFPADTASFFIQAKNKKGRSFNVGIEVDEFKPPVFKPVTDRLIPWYVNIDTSRLSAVKKRINLLKEQEKFAGGGHLLKDVVIKAKKIVKGSKNLNGPGEADIVLDEKDLEKAGKLTLGNLLEQRVKSFRLGGKLLDVYVIDNMTMHLIIDGINVEFGMPEGIKLSDHIRTYLDYYTAEDIKGIEVMYGPSKIMTYKNQFLSPMAEPWKDSFVEITTRSGHGPFLKKTPGTYLYKPLPFTTARQFYAPKYLIKSTNTGPDIRSTIHWEPNVITDKDGKATIFFYTGDQPGTYTAIIEGADMNGNLGTSRQKIVVQK